MGEPLTIRGRPALPGVIALLQAAALPAVDISGAHLEHFFLAGSEENPKGLVGLEFYGTQALLRSLVVDQRARGLGLGVQLVRHAEDYASCHGVQSLYLLTTTAENFFQKLGYARCERASAPSSIRAASEFARLCPASSAFMAKTLQL